MEELRNQSRRDFLGKTLAVAAVAVLNPISVFINPKELFASQGDQTLATNYVVDLTKYSALSNINGSVAITLNGTKYTYAGNVKLPFRFILTKTTATTFVAVAGYCSHELSSNYPFDGTVIACSNTDLGHGSQFSVTGAVVKKPAKTALESYVTTYDAAANTVTIAIPKLAVSDGSPTAFAPELFQNYPNPVKESTTIRFKLHYYSKVTLTVTDAMGHVISVLTDGALPDGDHSFVFDSTIWPSGTYFYHLNVAGEVFTKQFVVVK